LFLKMVSVVAINTAPTELIAVGMQLVSMLHNLVASMQRVD